MRSLQWTQEQAVHVPEIDAQHRRMFELTDELRQALLTGEKRARLDLLRRALAAEISSHFSHEERLMREAEYPAYAWHERQHRTARAKLAILERAIEGVEYQPRFDAVESVAAWLRDHTSITDRMAASYLRNYWRARDCAAV